MIRGQAADVTQIECDRQRILVSERLTGIEIEPGEYDVTPLGERGIHTQPHQRVLRIGIDDDAAMLIPLPVVLLSSCITRLRKDVAGARRERRADDQYILKYRSSSHSLTLPMYSCHSSRLASTNRS